MNTHDIETELPPLPEWVDWPVTVSEMSTSEVKEAMQDYARAAIEADRKRRGEPVGWHSKQYGVVWMAIKPGNLVAGTQWFIQGRQAPVAEVVSPGSLVWHIPTSELEHGTVFYTAPQPAEPDVLPGEAVLGFSAWLTSLKTPVTFSECHGAAIGADLAVAYNNSQGFNQVREDFHKRLKPYPKYEPSQPAEPVKVPRLYQHTDGRYGLSFGSAKFAQGEPAWYAVPIDVYEDGQV